MTRTLPERDVWVAGVAAVVAAIALTFALRVTPASDTLATTPVVAQVRQATGDVKVRFAQTLGWTGAVRGSDVHDGDALFVPPGAEATLAFADGTELALDERSLVVIEKPRAGVRSVTLRQGSVSGRAGAQGLTLQTPNGEAQLAARSEARVELTGPKKLEVSLKKGSAKVKGGSGKATTLASGERVAALDTGTQMLAAWPVALTAPGPQARFPFRGAPAALTLSWTGVRVPGAKVQLARDRLFAFVDDELIVAGEQTVLKEPAKGVTWWRIIDSEGQPLSEARRFSCVEDVAPVAMYPRNGDVLLTPLGTVVTFAWTPLPGISKYRLEISPSQGFEPVTASGTATGASLRFPLSVNEGVWFWRVRADEESGLGAPSEPLRFRVIHKGIPEAPELLNPEIEVSP